MFLRKYLGSRYYYYPRKVAHKALYRISHGTEMNWESPSTLDEKIHKLITTYGRAESVYADKVKVRNYVEKCGLKELLPTLYGIWENINDVDIDKLPEKFVLKTNHASGGDYIVICKDKTLVDWSTELKKIQSCLKINFAKYYCEYHYKYIKPLIFAEELLDDKKEDRMIDYKIHCFDGKPYCVQVISNRSGNHILHNVYDFDWNELDFVTDGCRSNKKWDCPKSLPGMYEAARKLSAPFKYARIDFYDVKGKPYFGEITLSPAGGNLYYFNKKAQKVLGEMIII